MSLKNKPTEENLNHVLTKLKFVEGRKIYLTDANRITGCTLPVIMKAFEELGKPVLKKKMNKNGESYCAILNVEPILAEDRTCVIKTDPKWIPPTIDKKIKELPVTPLINSDFGKHELSIFWIFHRGQAFTAVYKKDDNGDRVKVLIRVDWYSICDNFGRQFVCVLRKDWDHKHVNIDKNFEGPYYGRIKISDNKTKYERGQKYCNLYEVERYGTKDAQQIYLNNKELISG